MREGQSSRTAERVAAYRAVHQRLDSPLVLVDPLASRIVNPKYAAVLRDAPERLDESAVARATRAIVVVRSRIAEEEVGRAAADGVRQYVLLGAGLDTFAYRNPYPDVRVFEVDHPSTQDVKRRRLAAADIPVPRNVTFVPCDFSRDALSAALAAAGFSRAEGAVFGWLGVVMYLELEDVLETLRYIADQASPTTVVFDYPLPVSAVSWAGRLFYRKYLRRLDALGEPWRTFFTPEDIRVRLRGLGFDPIDDLDADAMNARYLANRRGRLSAAGMGHIVVARRSTSGARL